MWKINLCAHTQCKQSPDMVPEGLSGSPALLTTTVSLRKQKVLISPARSANRSDWLRIQHSSVL